MTTRLIGGAIVILILIGLSRMLLGMSPSGAAASAAVVRSLEDATISVDGLGDLRIGETMLGDVFDRYPGGRPALMLSEDFGIEVTYAGGGLVLMFCAETDGAAHRQAMRDGPRGVMLALHSTANTFRSGYPDYAAIPLTSIAVRRPWFRGTTDAGIALGDPFADVPEVHRPGGGASFDPFTAGNSWMERTFPPVRSHGLSIHPDREVGSTVGETAWEIAARARGAGAEVDRIVVYRQGW